MVWKEFRTNEAWGDVTCVRLIKKWSERFAIECFETKTTVIFLTNHDRHTTQWTNQNSHQIYVTCVNRGKTGASLARLVSILIVIGWESGSRLFTQSQSVVKKNKTNANTFLMYWKPLLCLLDFGQQAELGAGHVSRDTEWIWETMVYRH